MSKPNPLDILFVNPVFLSIDEMERELSTPYFPLGLLYLAAFMRERGFKVGIFDGTFSSGFEEFRAILSQTEPNVIGITAVQPNRETALNLAEIAKSQGAFVILGGPDPTYTPQTYLANPSVDIVVHHEGELTLAEILCVLKKQVSTTDDLYSLDGIAFRDQVTQEITINPRRPYLLNLDELPFPARDLIDMDQYLDFWRENNGYASVTISIARGCPYGCQWCAEAVHGQEFRQRSPESVAAEVKALMDNYNIDRLRVVDDVDGIDRAWVESWARAAEAEDAVVPFEPLYESRRQNVPMLDIRDSL